jgi:hypothetical protein
MRPRRAAAIAALFALVFLFGMLGPFRGGLAGPAAGAAPDSSPQGAPNPPPGTDEEWPLDALQATSLWALDPSQGAGVSVAVVDTGIVLNSPALAGTAITLGPAPQPKSLGDSHGTEVAELIAGRQTGLAPGARLIDIYAASGKRTATSSDLAAGITEAVQAGARIINVSIGVPKGTAKDNQAIYQAVKQAIGRGCLVVASVGADVVAKGGKGALYPADVPGVIAVAATGKSMRPLGPLTGHGAFAVYAPGIGVTATDRKGRTYSNLTDNGFAAAYVSAAAALIWSAHPNLPEYQLAQQLVTDTSPPTSLSSRQRGVLDPLTILAKPQPGPAQPAAAAPRTPAAAPAGPAKPNQNSASSPARLSPLGAFIVVFLAVFAVMGLALLAIRWFSKRRGPPTSGGGTGIPIPYDWDLEPR